MNGWIRTSERSAPRFADVVAGFNEAVGVGLAMACFVFALKSPPPECNREGGPASGGVWGARVKDCEACKCPKHMDFGRV